MTQSPGLVATVKQFAASLRFPYLVLFTASIFLVDLFIPDIVPFADEIILALVTLALTSFKKKCLDAVIPPVDADKAPTTFDATAKPTSPR
jgi:hypothetical protein